jgi:hypothetical protein
VLPRRRRAPRRIRLHRAPASLLLRPGGGRRRPARAAVVAVAAASSVARPAPAHLGGAAAGAVDAGARDGVARHDGRGAPVGGVVAADEGRRAVPVPPGAQGGVPVPHRRPAAARAALGEVLRRRRRGALLRLRARDARAPPPRRLPAAVALPPPAGAEPGRGVGRGEHGGRGAPAAGERAAGPGERALRARLRVLRPAPRLPRRVRLPHPVPPELRELLRRRRAVPRRRPGP